ncbi:hypothetical protein M1E08_20695 [Erwinia sp. PK3-005]|uniref:DNA gyrase subunit B n=2 Tax=Mixta hanseatica TaxID=2872648 RepID=A0ABY4RD24_9GAMM|nr:hypothetical protein [Mixta hanseatica]UQY44209.1 hypothetical protein K6958_00395 [Mixta hanseatica]
MGGCKKLPGIQVATGLTLLAWPFMVWFGLTHNSLHWLLPLIALLLILRLWQAKRTAGPMRVVMQSAALVGIVLCIASTLLKTHQLLLFYPVVVNLLMLALFGGSLWTAMPLVERLARLRDPQLPPEGVRYTRRVTQVWCLFFIVNGSIALFTALQGNMRLWTAWNGIIAYGLMGLLMAVEWLVRRQVIKRKIP